MESTTAEMRAGHGGPEPGTTGIVAEDRLRADLYRLLAALLARPPSNELLAMVSGLSGDDSELGRGMTAMARIAQNTDAAVISQEYHDLFIGLGRGELVPFGSYYLTGFLHEKPLARLRETMAAHGIERSADASEPEDHIAAVCDMMAALILGDLGRPASLQDQREFFNGHVGNWALHFFGDLEGARSSVLYAAVGRIGRLFMEIEATAFAMD